MSSSPVWFVSPPQETVLKGRPIVPAPCLAFAPRPLAGFPLLHPASALPAITVTCFVLDKDSFSRDIFIDEALPPSLHPHPSPPPPSHRPSTAILMTPWSRDARERYPSPSTPLTFLAAMGCGSGSIRRFL